MVAKEDTNKCEPPKATCTCCRCKTIQQQETCVYVQPRVREPLKLPTAKWGTSREFDDTTTYREAYVPCTSDKIDKVVPEGALSVNQGEISKETTTRSSYPPKHGALPATPHVPCEHSFMGTGNMQTITTNREDYAPKVTVPPAKFYPVPAMKPCGDWGFNSATTNRIAYQPPPEDFVKAKPFRPAQVVAKAERFDGSTVYNASYIEYEPHLREERSSYRGGLQCSPQPLEGESTYRSNFLPPEGDHRVRTYKPMASSIKFVGPTEPHSLYRKSYLGLSEIDQPEKLVPEGALKLDSGSRFAEDSTYKMNFGKLHGEPAKPYVPCRRGGILGVGSMLTATTQRLDYTAKPFQKVERLKPSHSIFTPNAPINSDTTSKVAYAMVDPRLIDRGKTFKPPVGEGLWIKSKSTYGSTQRQSYLPWDTQPRKVPPWSKRPDYVQPTKKMEGKSVNAISYQQPGEYVCKGDKFNIITNEQPCCKICCCCKCG